jgi:1-acyl-sn-glycerol-3-phosphate acyltransferase
MSFLRSLLFSTPSILVATAILDLLSMLCSFFDRSGDSSHRVARFWGRLLMAVSFIRVRVEGLEKLDPRANYVFVSNHSSFLDIPAILARLPYQFRFFAKKSLYRIPFLGWHLRWAGHIPVDRGNARASLKSMTEGARRVAQGHVSMLIFPEGGRSKPEQGLRVFKEGAAYIAIKAGVPLVPVALVGLRDLLPMGSGHIRSGNVTLRIADPIPTAGVPVSAHDDLTRRLHREVARMLEGGAG